MNPSDEYILNQPEPFRRILLHLQSVIEKTIPEVEMRYKYRVPFYYVHGKPFCYLNQSKNYIDVGFWHGIHLTKNVEFLTSAGRKTIKSLRFKTLEEINNNILIEILNDAYSVRGQKFYK